MDDDLTPPAKPRKTKWFLVGASIILWSAGSLEFFRFVLQNVHYFNAGIYGDGLYYFAMARGILNGLHLYSDLFESKPPVIFWLSALSLLTTKDDTLYRLILTILLAAIPAVLSLFAVHLTRSHGRQPHRLFVGIAFLFGSAMASFAINRSHAHQTEGFGVVVAILCVLLFAYRSKAAGGNLWKIAASASCFAIAALTKEPFTLAMFGGLLVLVSTKQDVKDAAKVIVLGGLLAIGILVLSGTVHGYFSIYLPEIFSGRIPQNVMYHDYRIDTFVVVPAPLWIRGLDVATLFRDMWSPSPGFVVGWFPFLGLAIALLFLTHQCSDEADDYRWGWCVIGILTVACFLLFLDLVRVLEQVLAFLQFKIPWGDAFFRGKLLLLSVYGLAWLVPFVLLLRQSPRTAKRVAVTVLVLYLASVAVATGGEFRPQYFLFAVPVYVACFVALLRRTVAPSSRPWTTVTMAALACLLILNAVNSPRFPYPELDRQEPPIATSVIAQSQQLDALLTACEFSRYFLAWSDQDKGGNLRLALQGLTVHSPYQLDYGLLRAFPRAQEATDRFRYGADERPNAFFHAKFLQDLADAPIVVYAGSTAEPFADEESQQVFRQHFSVKAPPCAQPLLPIGDLSLFFRRAAGSAKPEERRPQ
jgi:hypothetical protein